jgi:small subunit ribosomal protein S4
MGAPIKHRKKFVSHKKRWDKQTIVDEAVLVKDYALKNKREVRKVELLISKLKGIAKELNRTEETKNSDQAKHFIESLKIKGFLPNEATSLDEVLDITLRDILERRLSNVLYKKGMAKTPSQARQFIVHRHVKVNGQVVSSPSYSVTLTEESSVEFTNTSSLFDENHPERSSAETLKAVTTENEMVSTQEDKSPNEDEREAMLDDEEAPEVKTE